MKINRQIFLLYATFRSCSAFALPTSSQLLTTRDNDGDPADPGWIKDFAALGDSYEAGIGAGNVLNGNGDVACSRYDSAYPVLMQEMGFGGKPKQTFLACSGDESSKVIDQVKKLADDSQDLVTMSAGGNDALLSEVLKACVYLSSTQEKCNEKLAATKKAIDDDLFKNIDDLLQALAPKVRQGGIVVYTLYAQFFNADTDRCSSQAWNWGNGILPQPMGIKLTKDLRKQMNELVVDANTKIQSAIASQSGSTRPARLNIQVVDWDKAVQDNHGRFCEEGSADDPADPSNAGLMFQRLNAGPMFIPPEKLKALQNRDVDDTANLVQRGEAATHSLEKRIPIPDDIARVFHPTTLGHELIAAYSMMAIFDARKKTSTAKPPTCPFQPPQNNNPDPKCDVSLASGFPSNVFRPNVYTQFCDEVEKDPKKKLSWIVDSMGHQIPNKSKRSPPPDPGAYNDIQITLDWTGGDNACGKGCKDAYYTMATSPCGRTAGERNIMACSASSDSNCGAGTFDYNINPGPSSKANCNPPPKAPSIPQPGPRVCTPYDQIAIQNCGFKDISPGMLDSAINAFDSVVHGMQDLKKLPNQTQIYGRDENPTFMLNIGYVPGCTDFDKQVVDNPQGKSGDPSGVSISYQEIIRQTYKLCTGNNGLGGYQDYGCLRYGFYPTKIKGLFSDTTPKHYDNYWNAKNKWCGDAPPSSPWIPMMIG